MCFRRLPCVAVGFYVVTSVTCKHLFSGRRIREVNIYRVVTGKRLARGDRGDKPENALSAARNQFFHTATEFPAHKPNGSTDMTVCMYYIVALSLSAHFLATRCAPATSESLAGSTFWPFYRSKALPHNGIPVERTQSRYSASVNQGI